MPCHILITEGRITKGNQKIPMYVLAQLRTEMDCARQQARGKGLELNLAKGGKTLFDQLKSSKLLSPPLIPLPKLTRISGFATG